MEAETVRDQLYQLNVVRSMGPDRIHPRVPEELVKLWQDLSLSGTKGLGSLGRTLLTEAGQCYSTCPTKKDVREDPVNYRLFSLISVPANIMEYQILLGTIKVI